MKPSRRMRLVFALIGAGATLAVALLAEAVFSATDTAYRLDRANAPSLLFVNDVWRRLQREGGQTGDVRATLLWNNRNDLDLWCVDPSGERIYYMHPRSASGGHLDVDMNANPAQLSDEPVENIFWPEGESPRGRYEVLVHHYANHGGDDPTPFRVEVYNHGRVQTYDGEVSHGEPPRIIATFTIASGRSLGRHLPRGFWPALLVAAAWTGLLALALFGALAGALYVYYGRPRMRARWWGRRAPRAFGWGILAGAAGQGLYGLALAALPNMPGGPARIAGWILLGGILAYGLSGAVPCVPWGLATRCGLLGGFAAFLGFTAALPEGDAPGRILAATILGFAIGWAVSVVRAPSEPREAPAPPPRVRAVHIHAGRVSPAGVLRAHGSSGAATVLERSTRDTRQPSLAGHRNGTAPFED